MVSDFNTFAHKGCKIATQFFSFFSWYLCYYPQRSRDALSPVCRIFCIDFSVKNSSPNLQWQLLRTFSGSFAPVHQMFNCVDISWHLLCKKCSPNSHTQGSPTQGLTKNGKDGDFNLAIFLLRLLSHILWAKVQIRFRAILILKKIHRLITYLDPRHKESQIWRSLILLQC